MACPIACRVWITSDDSSEMALDTGWQLVAPGSGPMRLGPTVGRLIRSSIADPRYLDLPHARASVTTREEAIAIALALPGVVRGSAFGNDDFRVRNKIFLAFPQPDRVTIKLGADHAHVLVAADPETYIPHPGKSGADGWTRVILARVDPEKLADLVYESWSHVAPKRLLDSRTAEEEVDIGWPV